MPTSTFYHLPEEKRQKLISAIRQEILRVPYDEVSINQIIQTAQISRGSFYQYFTDKNDMLQMVIREMLEKMTELSVQSLKQHRGDPFAVIGDALDLFCYVCEKEELRRLYHNLLNGLKVKDDRFTCQCVGLPEEGSAEILSLLDRSALDIRSEEDLYDMSQILVDLFKWALSELMTNPEKKDEIRARFQNKVSILRRGMSAKQEEK